MKKIGDYSMRGQLQCGAGREERIILFDGVFDTGHRIKSFRCELADRSNTSVLVASLTCATEPGLDPGNWNFDDQREIAWAVTTADANAISTDDKTFIDRDNLIIQDLYISGYCYGDADAIVNYIIELEKYSFSEWTGSLAMVRNRSQA